MSDVGKKQRPILFSAPMVRALLDGRKTQTRRIVKLPANAREIQYWAPPSGRSQVGWADPGVNYWTPDPSGETSSNHIDPCPYGQPGDQLWVRETWADVGTMDPGLIVYRADYPACVPRQYENVPSAESITWKPSIHMFRKDSRILLEVVSVRVERLQDISEEDAIAEGVEWKDNGHGIFQWHGAGTWNDYAKDAYRFLWESINGAGSWDANPWVWVVEFRRLP